MRELYNARRRMKVLPPLVAALVLAGAHGVAPLDATALQAQPANRGASRFALALVSDARGKAIVDIGIDDFVVQEGGVDRDVLDVRVADYPIVIVVDNGAGAQRDFEAVKTAVRRFLERLGPRPLALVTTASPRVIASFEDERESAIEQLDRLEATADVKGEPLRAAALAAQTIRATGTLFSTIVMAISTSVEAEAAAADELAAPIIDSRAVLHVVADESTATNGGGAIRRLAQQTHGAYTPIFATPSFMPALEQLAVRLTTELLIEYIVPPGSRAVDPKVGVRIPGARVRGLGVAPR